MGIYELQRNHILLKACVVLLCGQVPLRPADQAGSLLWPSDLQREQRGADGLPHHPV